MTQKLKEKRRRGGFYLSVVAVLGILLALILLASCSILPQPAPKVVEVPKIIYVTPPAPEIIIRRYQPDALPEFVAPDDPRASSCLTPEAEDQQRHNMQKEQKIRRAARAWASGSP